MKCYKPDCREECDELKIAYCMFRRTKEQQELIAKIKGLTIAVNVGQEQLRLNTIVS